METTYEVAGMSCDHCVRAVAEEIGRVPGVSAVAVDLATGRVSVTSDRPLDREAVQAAVDEAGYELRGAPERGGAGSAGPAGPAGRATMTGEERP